MTFLTRNARHGLDQDSQSGFIQQRSRARRAAFGTVAAPSRPNAIFPNNKRPECIFPEMEETFGPLRSASAPCLKIEVRFDFQYLQSDIRRLLRSAEASQDQAAQDESQRSQRSRLKAPDVQSVLDTRDDLQPSYEQVLDLRAPFPISTRLRSWNTWNVPGPGDSGGHLTDQLCCSGSSGCGQSLCGWFLTTREVT